MYFVEYAHQYFVSENVSVSFVNIKHIRYYTYTEHRIMLSLKKNAYQMKECSWFVIRMYWSRCSFVLDLDVKYMNPSFRSCTHVLVQSFWWSISERFFVLDEYLPRSDFYSLKSMISAKNRLNVNRNQHPASMDIGYRENKASIC